MPMLRSTESITRDGWRRHAFRGGRLTGAAAAARHPAHWKAKKITHYRKKSKFYLAVNDLNIVGEVFQFKIRYISQNSHL